MLYIGYFHFDYEDLELGPSEGRFSFAVDAANVDEACQKMADEIPTRYGDLTMDAQFLYLDEIVEIQELPAGGMVLRAEHGPARGGDPVLVSLLPDQEGDGCAVYRQGPDPEDDPEGAAAFEPQPFLEFTEAEGCADDECAGEGHEGHHHAE